MVWLGPLPKPNEVTLSKIIDIHALDEQVITCTACPRLVAWRQEVAIIKRKSYQTQDYWAKPVTGFGPSDASMMIVGLAPGAHGANRTGRIFTGDRSGDWLYGALYRLGLAEIPTSTGLDDGQILHGVRITCAVRCAPPDNKPTILEKQTCAPWLVKELQLLLPSVRSIVALGSFAWSAILQSLADLGFIIPKPKPKFGHGVSAEISSPLGKRLLLIASYHPSQQNTFTGKLSQKQLDQVLESAKEFAQLNF
jgi:uracil-DNA glycosylase family 4